MVCNDQSSSWGKSSMSDSASSLDSVGAWVMTCTSCLPGLHQDLVW